MVIVTFEMGSRDTASFTLPFIKVSCALTAKIEKIPNRKIEKIYFHT